MFNSGQGIGGVSGKAPRLLSALVLCVATMGCMASSVVDGGRHASIVAGKIWGGPQGAGSTSGSSHADSGAGFIVIDTDDIMQWIEQPSQTSIVVHTMDSTVAPPAKTAFEYSASFTINATSARGQDDFYVAGTARNGDLVIEHWEVDPQVGALRTEWLPLGLPIGQPSPLGGLVTTVVGGTYVPVGERPAVAPNLLRSEILRTSDVPPVRTNAFGADPDGRFILFVTQQDELYQLPLTSSAQPVLLHTTATCWMLPFVTGMFRCQLVATGRVWELGPPKVVANPDNGLAMNLLTTILFDADNDGEFESIGIFAPHEQLDAIGFWDGMLTDFVFVWP